MVNYGFKSFLLYTYLALFKSRGTGFRLTPKRLAWLTGLLMGYPLLEGVVWTGYALDELLFRGYRQCEIRGPIFIVGNPRSGTTFLYHLLARDRRNLICTRTWELFFAPSITLRKVCRALRALDRRLGSPVLRQLAAWEARCQDEIVMHQLGLRVPEEDEYFLLHIWSTILIWQFTGILEGAIPLTYFDAALSEADKRDIMAYYRRCIQRHLYAHGRGVDHGPTRYYLSKAPSFSPKVGMLYRCFPGARFIYLVRNPLDMVASFVSSLEYGWRLFGDPPQPYSSRDYVLDMAEHWYRYPLECFERAPEGSYALVKFDDLVTDVEGTVQDIYGQLGLEISPAFARALREAARKSRRYRSKHKYRLEQMGLTREQIVARYRDIFRRFGFDTREPVTASMVEA